MCKYNALLFVLSVFGPHKVYTSLHHFILSSHLDLVTLLATSHLQKYSSIFSIWILSPSRAATTTKREIHCLLALSLLLVFWIACGGIGRLRGKRAPGWIISCSSTPDGHVAVTWRGNGKWHHYHCKTGNKPLLWGLGSNASVTPPVIYRLARQWRLPF